MLAHQVPRKGIVTHATHTLVGVLSECLHDFSRIVVSD
jgi:hypothetical protein